MMAFMRRIIMEKVLVRWSSATMPVLFTFTGFDSVFERGRGKK